MSENGQAIIVLGASAGGLEALLKIVGGLPAALPAAVLVVIHTSPNNPGKLPAILGRAGPLPAQAAHDREAIKTGRIYVAPADRHLIVKPGFVRTPRGPRENGFRPAVDPLFRTAALAYGPRVIGVILSGGLDDGTHGLMLIKQHGGMALVQDPAEAIVDSMPRSAIRYVDIDQVLPAAEMAKVLTRLAARAAGFKEPPMMSDQPLGRDVAEGKADALQTETLPGPPSVYTCPDCGGVLCELDDGKLLRFRCHTGHGYTAESLLAGQESELEAAFWAGLRALEENAALRRRMASRMAKDKLDRLAEQFTAEAADAELRADALRDLLFRPKISAAEAAASPAADLPAADLRSVGNKTPSKE